jgi:uncharacterized membrane protein
VIIVENSREGHWVRIQARSHFSLGVGGLLTLIGTLSALTLLLASVAAWLGYWPVLAIAALQVVLLAMIFVRTWKSAWTVETISIDSECIAVLQERYSGHNRIELDAAWARVVLQQPDIRWYTPELLIKSGKTSVRLGEYLNAAEKRELAEALRKAVGQFSAWQAQKIENEVT